MKWPFIWLIRFYQRFISPLKRQPTCRFESTCSAYALEAFRKRGFFVGFALTVYRIFRCQPLCPGGYDPVPDRGFPLRRKKVSFDNENTEADEPPLACRDYLAPEEEHSASEHGSDE